jgi:hypothetical protein
MVVPVRLAHLRRCMWRGGGFEVGLCWRAQASWEARPWGGLVICSITVIREPVPPRSNGKQLSRYKSELHTDGTVFSHQRFLISGRGLRRWKDPLDTAPELDPKLNWAWPNRTQRYYRNAICDPHVSRCLNWIISLLPFSASDADMAVNLLVAEPARWILPAMLSPSHSLEAPSVPALYTS